MPEWALILTVASSVAAALAAIVGMFWHKLQSAKNSGRFEEQLAGLAKAVVQLQERSGACQLVERCDREMTLMGDRIDSAHKRMDRHEERLGKHDDLIRILSANVEALKTVKQ
jgi:hypothetical protein